MNNIDAVIVGTGFSGSIIARKLSDNLNLNVLVLEKRNHIAGNMYDKVDEHGVRVQLYGPHTIITDHKEIIDFLNVYSKWKSYDVTAKVEIDNKLFTLPFNFKFIEEYYGHDKAKILIQKLKKMFPSEERVSIYQLLDCGDEDISSFAKMLCEKDYYPYSSKQWGVPMDKMDRSVISRVKFALSYDNRYIQQKYQYYPIYGYKDFFSNILKSNKIKVEMNCDAIEFIKFSDDKVVFTRDGIAYDCPVVFTGAIDELFNCIYGPLPYRSLDIKFQSYECDSYQDVPFVSYPQADGYTRIVEYKKLTQQDIDGVTSVSIEYPVQYEPGKNLPYYPIINDENMALYYKYKKLADKYENLFICGRLGDYKYYNMDAAIIRAFEVEKKIEEYIELRR